MFQEYISLQLQFARSRVYFSGYIWLADVNKPKYILLNNKNDIPDKIIDAKKSRTADHISQIFF